MKNKEFFIPVTVGIFVTAAASTIMLFMNKSGAIICAALGIILTAILCFYTNRRYRAISDLNDYLLLVCSGNYDLALEDNTEGELFWKLSFFMRAENVDLSTVKKIALKY